MSEALTYRCTRDEMLDWLWNERKEDILEVNRAINELTEEDYAYLLPLSGTKDDLIDALSDVPKRILWHGIDQVFPDLDEEDYEDEEESKKPSRQTSQTKKQYNVLYPKEINYHSFDLSLLNLDQDPTLLLKRIENYYLLRSKKDLGIENLTVLLSGPSGAGKTHLIKFLSKKLNKPVMFLTASSFLSKFVGETEQNTKEVFEYAEKNDFVLFIDEIEGLLQSRQGADHAWELTQVNELLVRLENFKGVCIGATNLYQTLDPAFYRRFTLKVEFSFMKPDVMSNFLIVYRPISIKVYHLFQRRFGLLVL